MKKYFFAFLLFFTLACQKQSVASKPFITTDRYLSTGIVLAQPYVLDYFFNNDYNVTQNVTYPNFQRCY